MQETRPIECERTRQQVSAALDSEVSQFERALVASHVAHCAECRAFQARAGWLADTLRAARPERLSTPLGPPSRRPAAWSPARVARLGSAAAAMVSVAFLGLLSTGSRDSAGGEQSLVASSLARPVGVNDLVLERRSTLASGQQALAYGTGGIGAYKPPLPPTI